MTFTIRRAAVVGAGTMGAGIAAHLANAGIPVLLLDIPSEDGARNAIVNQGLERARKSKPAAFMLPEVADRIEVGNIEDDLLRLREVDWVIEAAFEDLEVKRDLWFRIEPLVAPHAIVSSNSSGIPMHLQVEGRSEAFRKRFLGTHFFNPPRYMRLLELIPTPDTDAGVLATMADFGDRCLGKGVVIAKDVPGFAANRVGVYSLLKAMHAMLDLGLTPDVVDTLTGPIIGRPKSATFRTADLTGIDIMAYVAQGLGKATGEDFALPAAVQAMLERKMLGEKTGQGFYKRVKGADGQSVILTLNLETLEHEDRGKVRLAELTPVLALPTASERVKALLELEGPLGEFTRRTTADLLRYAASKVGVVTDEATSIDHALSWGFGWELGPFELAQSLGQETVARLLGVEPSALPATLAAAAPPRSAGSAAACSLDAPILLRSYKNEAGRIVRSNPDASLIDLGEGVALLEFTSKAHAIGDGVLQMFAEADEVVRTSFRGLVVGNQGDHFSAGADLSLMHAMAVAGDFEKLDAAVRVFQGMTTRLRLAPYPVVSAPYNLALGGGCEVPLWSDAVQAHAELYMGLVEIGVGIIPAAGGTTEVLIRFTEALPPDADPFVAVKRAFELIAMAKVSTSALEARKMGLLRSTDRITFNPDRVIADARRRVIELAAGYIAPTRRRVRVLGEAAYANLCAAAYMMREARQITEYEEHLARTLAKVLTGGTRNTADTVDEQVLLDLEREAFLHLVGQEKTRQRIMHTLKTGKTLRN